MRICKYLVVREVQLLLLELTHLLLKLVATSYGKKQKKKDLVSIMAAHGAPYVAQLSPNKWKIMAKGFQKALETEGPCFINTVSACTTEWKFDPKDTIHVTDLGN